MGERKNRGLFSENESEEHEERNLFTRFAEGAFLFGVACFVIRWGVMQLLCVRVPLTIIASIVLVIVIAFRTYRWRKHDDF